MCSGHHVSHPTNTICSVRISIQHGIWCFTVESTLYDE
nr:MAG TPA: hypothetical protein [Caudoviricetes sp.]